MSDESEKPIGTVYESGEKGVEFWKRLIPTFGPHWARDKAEHPSDKPVTVPHPSGDGSTLRLRFPVPVVAHPVPLQRVLDDEPPAEDDEDLCWIDLGDEELDDEPLFKP